MKIYFDIPGFHSFRRKECNE